MALSNESCDLAFDTEVLRNAGKKYSEMASTLRGYSQQLDQALSELASTGWTTSAGQAFQIMAQVNWEKNIEKYADLLETLKNILDSAANDYDTLVADSINNLKLVL